MNNLIAYCGLLCDRCLIHLAGIETDENKKSVLINEIITVCKNNYGIEYGMGEINGCDGCTSGDGKIFQTCSKCAIRKCAVDRKLTNCALCENYACEKLSVIFDEDPTAKIRLDNFRNNFIPGNSE